MKPIDPSLEVECTKLKYCSKLNNLELICPVIQYLQQRINGNNCPVKPDCF